MCYPVVHFRRRVEVVDPDLAAGSRDVLRAKPVLHWIVEHTGEGVPRREEERGGDDERWWWRRGGEPDMREGEVGRMRGEWVRA